MKVGNLLMHQVLMSCTVEYKQLVICTVYNNGANIHQNAWYQSPHELLHQPKYFVHNPRPQDRIELRLWWGMGVKLILISFSLHQFHGFIFHIVSCLQSCTQMYQSDWKTSWLVFWCSAAWVVAVCSRVIKKQNSAKLDLISILSFVIWSIVIILKHISSKMSLGSLIFSCLFPINILKSQNAELCVTCQIWLVQS